jgi:hypothetical protein
MMIVMMILITIMMTTMTMTMTYEDTWRVCTCAVHGIDAPNRSDLRPDGIGWRILCRFRCAIQYPGSRLKKHNIAEHVFSKEPIGVSAPKDMRMDITAPYKNKKLHISDISSPPLKCYFAPSEQVPRSNFHFRFEGLAHSGISVNQPTLCLALGFPFPGPPGPRPQKKGKVIGRWVAPLRLHISCINIYICVL